MLSILFCLLFPGPVPTFTQDFAATTAQEAPDFEQIYVGGHISDEQHLGAWRVLGYGFVVLFEEHGWRVFSETSVASWEVPSGDLFETEQLFISASDTGPRRRFTMHPLASPMTFEKLERLPAACLKEVDWTPARLFDAYAATMEEYYPFFAARHFDWPGRLATARKSVNAGISEEQLFEAMAGTLKGLGDGHMGLEAAIDGEEHSLDSDRSKLLQRIYDELPAGLDEANREGSVWLQYNLLQRAAMQGIERDILRGKARTSAGQFVWGRVEDEIGYIMISGMGFGGNLSLSEQVERLHAAFDEMLGELSGVQAIVLDCSLNGGGMDLISHAIASHFIDEPSQPYSKGPASHPEIQHQIWLEPWSGKRFTGPVFLLSSEFTASAAEIFQLCLKDQKHVTLMGTPGATIFSDIIPKALPNGWKLGMTIEAYRDARGTCYEGVGVPVDVQLPFFENEDLRASHTEALVTAMDIIWNSI